jgi:DNA-binding LacI/PurR family transcriptional regulator
LQALGYQMILVHVEDGTSLEAAMPKLASYRIDAIFIARGVLDNVSAQSLAAYRIPIIAFHTPIAHDWVSSVCADNAAAGRIMADHFHAKGARKCAFIGGLHSSTTDRLSGFRQGLELHHLAAPLVVQSPFTYEGGRQAGHALLAGADRPDAIFCGNDLIAIGCLDSARELGLAVPEDVMIAGFDNIPETEWFGNRLTTFGQLEPNMVDASIAILRNLAEQQSFVSVQVVVPVELIERQTTRRGG